MLKTKVRNIYCKLLGQTIKQELTNQKIPQNEVSYYFDDDIQLISAPTVSEILKGRRNITLNTVDALQETLSLPTVKSVFFPNHAFCKSLITHLTELMITDDFSTTKRLFKDKEKKIQQNLSYLANTLYNFFPDFPEEETSYQIADILTEWLIEFVALVSKL